MTRCSCAETLVGATRVPPPQWHNCEYIRKRNEQIGEALRRADAAAARHEPRWMAIYSQAMDELCRGL